MSNPNENPISKQASDYIVINENGELVVKDPQLAESLQELSLEELEQVAGGRLSTNNGTNCGCNGLISESSDSALQ